jgi:8-oxo-dGTP pyrophosphatase MutT (NUDIX family)
MIRGAKVIILDPANNMLVLYRSGTHPFVPHTPDLPGGKVEKGETMIDGLLREIREETGIELDGKAPELISTHEEREYYGKDYYLELYEVKLDSRPVVKPSYEHDMYSWIPRSEVKVFGKLYNDLLSAYQQTRE